MIKILLRYSIFIATIILTFTLSLEGGVNISKSVIFMDSKIKSVPITLTNPSNEEIEVWIEFKFGYITSNEDRKTTIVYDTLPPPDPNSAVEWVRAYPQRFKIGPFKSQVVRITASPPANLPDGEYWSRIIISQIPSKDLQKKPKKTSGMEIIQKIGVPYHYRHKNVSTGIEVTNLAMTSIAGNIVMSIDMVRLGNSSFWGTIIINIIDNNRKRIGTFNKDIVVYRNYNGKFLFDRKNIPAGSYTVEANFRTDKRTDASKKEILQYPLFQLTTTLNLD